MKPQPIYAIKHAPPTDLGLSAQKSEKKKVFQSPQAEPPSSFFGRRYLAYNDWMRATHGGRLQKISVDAGFTCPNRDGALGLLGGCSFCNNDGFSPSYLKKEPDIDAQVDTGLEFLKRRYPESKGFLVYLQSYSNTYAPLPKLQALYEHLLSRPDISGLAIGTRPDCLPDEVLVYLASLATHHLIELEIGIESLNDEVLAACGRGHNADASLDAIARAKGKGLFVTGHLLIGLPKESHASLLQTAKILGKTGIDALKFHQLQIVKHTRLANAYAKDATRVPLLSPDDYIEQVIDMLEYVSPQTKIQRLGSEVPPSMRVLPDWGMRLERYPHLFEARLKERQTYQGRLWRA